MTTALAELPGLDSSDNDTTTVLPCLSTTTDAAFPISPSSASQAESKTSPSFLSTSEICFRKHNNRKKRSSQYSFLGCDLTFQKRVSRPPQRFDLSNQCLITSYVQRTQQTHPPSSPARSTKPLESASTTSSNGQAASSSSPFLVRSCRSESLAKPFSIYTGTRISDWRLEAESATSSSNSTSFAPKTEPPSVQCNNLQFKRRKLIMDDKSYKLKPSSGPTAFSFDYRSNAETYLDHVWREFERKKYSPEAILALKKPPVYVVDGHNDALLPIMDYIWALKQGNPTSAPRPLRMLHFDSHPDLSCLAAGDSSKVNVAKIAKDSLDSKTLHKSSTIATWILPLVLSGWVSEIIWVSGWWCSQMDVGSYDLLVGCDRNSSRMKVCSVENDITSKEYERVSIGVGEYWNSSGFWVKHAKNSPNVELLQNAKRWRLHVFRIEENGLLPPEQLKKVQAILTSPFDLKGDTSSEVTPPAVPRWILDIDEDYFSCVNPFIQSFKDLFGVPSYELLKETYFPINNARERWNFLKAIITRELYKGDPTAVVNDSTKEKKEQNQSKSRNKIFQTQEDKDFLENEVLLKLKEESTIYEGSSGEEEDREDDKETSSSHRLLSSSGQDFDSLMLRFKAFLQKFDTCLFSPSQASALPCLEKYCLQRFISLEHYVHEVGTQSSLPDHNATAEELVRMFGGVHLLLQPFASATLQPALITLATSAKDFYVPRCHSTTVHRGVLQVLESVFGGILKQVIRLDVGLSIQ